MLVGEQHQGREAPRQTMEGDGLGLRERQRQLAVGRTSDGAGEFPPERHRQCDRAPVASSPRVGVGPEPMQAWQEIPRHTDGAVPNIVEAHLADAGKQPLQTRSDIGFEPLGAIGRLTSAPPVTRRWRAS